MSKINKNLQQKILNALKTFGDILLRLLLSNTDQQEALPNRKINASDYYANSILILAVAVIKADGIYRQQEINCVNLFFEDNFGESTRNVMMRYLKRLLSRDLPLERATSLIKENLDYRSRLQILHFLYKIASSDHLIARAELKVIEDLSKKIGINKTGRDSVSALFTKYLEPEQPKQEYSYTNQKTQNYDSSNSYYTILEISPTASNAEIKAAYRRMAKLHHPDTVSHLGEDFRDIAKERFQKIVEAYEKIRKLRGL